MSATYSTRSRDMASGRTFSTRGSTVTVMPAAGAPNPVAAPRGAAVGREIRFQLSTKGAPAAGKFPGGVTGAAAMTGVPGGLFRVNATLSGVGQMHDPAVGPMLWLVHDLSVPADLLPADQAALPKGRQGTGNRPGQTFTLDGEPPTYSPAPNVVSVAVSPGRFQQQADGAWTLSAALDAAANRSFHPLVILGPTVLADMNAAVPSGTVARILTDLFMRPASVHPELPPNTRFQQRLMAIASEALAAPQPSYLDPELFSRAAVTIEGPLRTTPRLLPTREGCILIGPRAET